jgi:hypothetical protein
VQVLVAPVRCQSHGAESEGMAAAVALAVKSAKMAALKDMVYNENVSWFGGVV